MLKKIQERIFPFFIALSALSISVSAAFYSVSGLSKLFAGATLAVIIMASSLEIAKLVIASLLYQYRKTLPLGLKIYLTIATIVLVLITSMGIYGFLSSAYQETASKAGTIDAQITLIETKRDNTQNQLDVYNGEKENIDKAIADLRSGLSNNVIQYTNAEGQVITTTSSATRKALEKQLDQAIERQTEINSKVDILNQQLFDYETEIVEVSTNNDLAGELGPLKYLSGLTGISMDKIINYLLLVIIFVFDPLAISLVIAANFAFEQLDKKYKKNIYGEKVPIDKEEQHQHIIDIMKTDEESGLYDNIDINLEKEFDEDHALDEVLNDMVEDLEEEEPPKEEPKPNKSSYDIEKDKILKISGISGWRKSKMLKELEMKKKDDDDLTIIY
jgi:hypothetical protein